MKKSLKNEDNQKKESIYQKWGAQNYASIFMLVIFVLISSIDYLKNSLEINFINIISIINNCTFTSLVPVVVCLLISYFSTPKKKRNKVGLTDKIYIVLTVTTGYAIVWVVDACIAGNISILIMFLFSLVYIYLFLTCFIKKSKESYKC